MLAKELEHMFEILDCTIKILTVSKSTDEIKQPIYDIVSVYRHLLSKGEISSVDFSEE